MPIDNPAALVEEFKKTGEFERLRRELLAQFQQDESYPSFKEGVEGIARKRLANDQLLHFQTTDVALKELTQEIQRYPIVERAVANVRTLSDPTLLAGIQKTMQKILHDEKGGNSSLTTPKENLNRKDAENGTVRTEVPQTSGDQQEKTAQDAQLESDSRAAEQTSASVVTTVSESLGSQTPVEPPTTKTAENLASTPEKIPSSEEANALTNAPPESNSMEAEPSSSAISAENSNVNMPIDDQRQITTDIEMEDVQSTNQTDS